MVKVESLPDNVGGLPRARRASRIEVRLHQFYVQDTLGDALAQELYQPELVRVGGGHRHGNGSEGDERQSTTIWRVFSSDRWNCFNTIELEHYSKTFRQWSLLEEIEEMSGGSSYLC